jgi:hypothetical protein
MLFYSYFKTLVGKEVRHVLLAAGHALLVCFLDLQTASLLSGIQARRLANS